MTKKQPKRIPTILGLIVLGAALTGGIFLIKNVQNPFPQASGETIPSQVKITNTIDSSFTVSWITQSATSGFLTYGETEKLGQTGLDERDEGTNSNQNYFTHYVVLKNLKPNTQYFFKISSAGKSFDQTGKPYTVTTAPTLSLPLPEEDIAYGMILEKNGGPAKGAIVYLSLANTAALSSLVKNDGSWMIPLSTARSFNLNSYSNYDKELQVEDIFVQGGNLGTSIAVTTTKNDNPVSVITLGENFDFRKAATIASPTPTLATQPLLSSLGSGQTTPSPSPTPTSTPTKTPAQSTITPTQAVTPTLSAPTPTVGGSIGSRFSLPTSSPTPATESPAADTISILSPGEGENIGTQLPEFTGTGPANESLIVEIQSEAVISGQTLVDKNGDWKWTPPDNLSPGEHTVTVTYKDKNGLTQKVVRSFTVLAAEEEEVPSFSASPSAQLSTTPAATPTAEPRTGLPPENQKEYKPGNLTVTIISLIMGIGLLFLGIYQLKSI